MSEELDPDLADALSRKRHVRRQHYVPQFYLRNFADGSGTLAVMDLDQGELLRKRHSPRSVCYADYFYAEKTGTPDLASQVTELAMEELEDKIAPLIPPACLDARTLTMETLVS